MVGNAVIVSTTAVSTALCDGLHELTERLSTAIRDKTKGIFMFISGV
jgi:hypothetical protein